MARKELDYEFLSHTRMFGGTTPEEIRAMLGCLDARRRSYEKVLRLRAARLGDDVHGAVAFAQREDGLERKTAVGALAAFGNLSALVDELDALHSHEDGGFLHNLLHASRDGFERDARIAHAARRLDHHGHDRRRALGIDA